MLELQDAFARKFHYLRLSVTDVCNFRCQYCLPDGYRPDGRKTFLTLDEIRHITQAFATMGTNKVRITGGEPSMRRDFTDIIEAVASTPGIRKVATTTNGYRMAERVADWRSAGLDAINVSLDSLDPRMFHQITGQNRFHEVMAGIEAAFAAGFEQVKVNTVLMRGLNDGELGQFLAWIKSNPIQLRFIELMQTGEMDQLFERHHVRGAAIKEKLLESGWQQRVRAHNDGPAEVFWHPDYVGEIGLIMPYAQDFCASCNRLRVSALGKLHLCLFGEYGVELRDLLQHKGQQAALQRRLREALADKKATHFLHQGQSGMTPHLASIGG
ncbi:GTP 3',8-cyclase MoaA [Oceanimonas baumannii]|uniref:GTP 3',8-cyclase n=1 Tax=Oceanimonas baumannii TaxID=129578 RepID=A0A235CFD0_9GAMM|nr:GTP 3',8-cyclase MoaA [Oceanimonas baumannii]OYD23079.1 GTP 3',8-cyclase MoaA [Oceanimonas baumannii]TDW58346.1 cyclic pyranopterin phosphate synthase [Oceanimonas baumannii]